MNESFLEQTNDHLKKSLYALKGQLEKMRMMCGEEREELNIALAAIADSLAALFWKEANDLRKTLYALKEQIEKTRKMCEQ